MMTYVRFIRAARILTALSALLWGACSDDCPSGKVEDSRGKCVTLASSDASNGLDGDGGTDAGETETGGEPDSTADCTELGCEGLLVCEVESGTCVECLEDGDCAAGLLCKESQCEGCSSHADCVTPEASRCDAEAERCAACLTDDDCADVVDSAGIALAVCDPELSACVQCTGTNYEACGLDDDGVTPLLCNSQTRSCSKESLGNGDLCGGCISDAQCPSGSRCVLEVFDEMELGYVCLPIEGDPEVEVGAITDCFGAGRPFRAKRQQVASLDGDVQNVCALAVTTCKTLLEHGSAVEGCNAEHAIKACGVEGLVDALCRSPEDSTAYRCVMPCSASEDCMPGYACNRAEARFCDFFSDTCFADTDCAEGLSCNTGRNVCE